MNNAELHLAQPSSYRVHRLASVIMIVMMVALVTMSIAMANDVAFRSIEQGIASGSEQMYNLLTAVVLPVAAVSFGWNAFKALFGGERGLESAKKNMLTIVLVIGLVWLAPIIVEQVSGWFSGADTGSVFTR